MLENVAFPSPAPDDNAIDNNLVNGDPLGNINLSYRVLERLRCPACQANLNRQEGKLHCQNNQCGRVFLVYEGVPIVIDEDRSPYTVKDIVAGKQTFHKLENKGITPKLLRLVDWLTNLNITSAANYRKLANELLRSSTNPLVLVVGGASLGKGLDEIIQLPEIEWVETDIELDKRTKLICDAHELPFEDETFDGVVVQAVLEHVLDPYRCVQEIFRVLKPNGLVYSETPFMQQVHGGRFDFTRFSHLGHRRLFRYFSELDSGPVCGSGMALAWAFQYFMMNFSDHPMIRFALRSLGAVMTFPLKYFDYLLVKKKGAFDAASSYFFMGRKSDRPIPDREILKHYRGAF